MTADRRLARTTGDWRRALLRDKVELERLVLEARARNVRQSARSERRLQRVLLSILYGALLVGVALSLRRLRAYSACA